MYGGGKISDTRARTHRAMTTAQINEFSPSKTVRLTKLVKLLEIKQEVQLSDDSQTNFFPFWGKQHDVPARRVAGN